MNELATCNAEWLASPADTMQAFVAAVLVNDCNYAYRSCYANVYDAAQKHDWDAALDSAIALRTYAQRAGDGDGERIARLLAACSLVALRCYHDARCELAAQFNAPGALAADLWHAALAQTVRGIAAYAQRDSSIAVCAFQMALNHIDAVDEWAYDRSTLHLSATQRRLMSQSKLRSMLYAVLREAIELLAV